MSLLKTYYSIGLGLDLTVDAAGNILFDPKRSDIQLVESAKQLARYRVVNPNIPLLRVLCVSQLCRDIVTGMRIALQASSTPLRQSSEFSVVRAESELLALEALLHEIMQAPADLGSVEHTIGNQIAAAVKASDLVFSRVGGMLIMLSSEGVLSEFVDRAQSVMNQVLRFMAGHVELQGCSYEATERISQTLHLS